jgi:nucleoside-diphosphate-sugar epimerase
MNNLNIFCFGFGQVAKYFIKKLKLENFNINLSTTSRENTHKKKFDEIDYTSFKFKGTNYDNKLIGKLKKSDHILVSIPPRDETDLVLKNFSKIIEDCNPKWITYLSATSVYGDHEGKWVNEESITNPITSNGVDRLSAEKLWLSLNLNKKIPLQVFRLSGIYSNENNILVRLKSGNAKLVNKKNHFFSRIHIEDIANILFESLSKFKSGEIYNISDDKPTPSEDITLYGAKILNIEKLKTIEIYDIESEMLKNFYKDSKKVSNKKMKDFFNYTLKFPTYIEGLNYIRNNLIQL